MSRSADAGRMALLAALCLAPQDPRVSASELVSLARGEDTVALRVSEGEAGSGPGATAVELRRSDIFRAMDLAAPGLTRDVLSQMTLAVVTRMEALEQGVDVPAAELEQQLEAALAEQAARFALEGDMGLSLEEYLARRHGWSRSDHRREMRQRVLGTLLLDRLVRLHQLTMDRDELQLLVVEDEALARRLAEDLNAGASFSVLARRHSVHPSAEQGGDLAAVPPKAASPLLEGRRGLQPGDILGPGPITVDDKPYWRLLRLVDRVQGRSVSWAEVREEVEAGLAARPVTPDEMAVFEARMGDRYRVSRPQGQP